MKKAMTLYLNVLFGKELELRVRLFHVLAITGCAICLIMTCVSIAGRMWVSMAINIVAGILSFLLLIHSARSRHYKFCYGMTIAVIFFVLFPSLFFYGGGYQGGMSFFFVFAVVFTVYMLDGWAMLAVTAAELVFYSFLCVLAWRMPELIVPFDSSQAVVTDIIIGFVTVSISLGATMFIQVRMYRKQQAALEIARREAEAASQAKSSFLANMSHEIRTPIHMILGLNEMIYRECHSSQVRDHSDKIQETGRMLMSLVDNVLDVSKIESGKMELTPAPYAAAELVEALSLIGKVKCKQNSLRFILHVSDNLPPMLYGDLIRIQQIAGNFLSNAAKYTEKGSVTLCITQEPCQEENQTLLCISVSDTGIGIDPEALSTLFEAFTRADPAAHRSIEGTGLGLTIARELTNLMGGTICVQSQPGEGSTFTVKLPQAVLQEAPGVRDTPSFTFLAPDVRILAVDDNAGNRELLQALLAPTRVQTDTARSGRECLQMVKDTPYHLILMDYMMPEMDGLQTLVQLQKLSGFETPVIALTADAAAETKQRLLHGGFSACLTKPVPWPVLRDALLNALPQALVTVLPEPAAEKEVLSEALAEQLKHCGILVWEAMPYFSGDPVRYAATARLFLRHDRRESAEAVQEDLSQLRFSIHALRGKAKNLGAVRLSRVCAHAETLCASGEQEELESLLPYLLFLWDRFREGLNLLVQEIAPEAPESTIASAADCEKQLPMLLMEFRRRPSLICIDSLLQAESSEEGKQQLQKIRSLVDAISFDEAGRAFRSYEQWKYGGIQK